MFIAKENIRMTEDMRWKQRYASYTSALQSLSDAVKLSQERPLSV